MPFLVNDRVDVRADKAHAWRPGAVRHVPSEDHPSCPNGCYAVELDTPVAADDWSGVTRRYGGSELVGGPANNVFVFAHTEKLAADDHIRTEGG